MNACISDLVDHFERGLVTRRQLIQGLSALVAAAAAPNSAVAQTPGLQAVNINHTSVLVTDLQKSADFYRRVFNLTVVSEDKPNRILRLGAGGTGVESTLVSLRQETPPGLIDHFAISVKGFNRDAVTQVLKQQGLTPEQNLEFGFHVKDPDGAVVQIV